MQLLSASVGLKLKNRNSDSAAVFKSNKQGQKNRTQTIISTMKTLYLQSAQIYNLEYCSAPPVIKIALSVYERAILIDKPKSVIF
jgi:hypothetical protein